MNILGFTSFGTRLEAGLSTNSGYYESRRNVGLQHNQILLPLVDRLLKDGDIAMKDIDLVVCTRGPGSFTALRIVLSTAKGLAAGADAGFFAVPTFDLVGDIFSWASETVVPFIDGKKNKIYSGFYHHGKKIIPEADAPKSEVLLSIEKHAPVLLVGEDLHLFEDEARQQPEKIKLAGCGWSLVKTLLEMGQFLFKKDGNCDKLTSPLYIRKSDAELQKIQKP